MSDDTESDGGATPRGGEASAPTEGVLATERPRAGTIEPSALSPPRTRLAVFGGARASVLAKVPAEADRFTQMLPLLVATAILSGISMAFAVATGVFPGQSFAWYAAIPVAVAWAALIFIVDRALTASMKSTKSRATARSRGHTPSPPRRAHRCCRFGTAGSADIRKRHPPGDVEHEPGSRERRRSSNSSRARARAPRARGRGVGQDFSGRPKQE